MTHVTALRKPFYIHTRVGRFLKWRHMRNTAGQRHETKGPNMAGKGKSRAEKGQDAPAGDFLRDYTPFRIDTSAPLPDESSTVLFWVDDVEYSAPDRVSAATALRALEIESTKGAAAAGYFMVVESLGPDAFRELTEGEAAKHLRYEDVQRLFAELGRRYYGQMTEMLGK